MRVKLCEHLFNHILADMPNFHSFDVLAMTEPDHLFSQVL